MYFEDKEGFVRKCFQFIRDTYYTDCECTMYTYVVWLTHVNM